MVCHLCSNSDWLFSSILDVCNIWRFLLNITHVNDNYVVDVNLNVFHINTHMHTDSPTHMYSPHAHTYSVLGREHLYALESINTNMIFNRGPQKSFCLWLVIFRVYHHWAVKARLIKFHIFGACILLSTFMLKKLPLWSMLCNIC